MNILVTGGTGFVGSHLAHALLAKGHKVSILGRSFAAAPVEDPALPAPVPQLKGAVTSRAQVSGAAAVPIRADLRDKAAVMDACAGMEAVFHVGALSAPWGSRADFFGINVEGTRSVVEGCVAHRVPRLVYVSSPSVVFDGRDQLDLTESAPYPNRFLSVYSLTKKLGEDIVNAAIVGGLHAVILRPKAIFGPGDRALLPRLIEVARRGRLPQIGDGTNLVDLTFIDNVVHALLLCLENDAALGKTFHITNDEHVPLWGVIRSLLERLGLPTRLRTVPLGVALSAAAFMEWQAGFTGKEPLLTRYSTAILARTQTYDIRAARRDLGYAPLVSVDEGIERTLAALTRN